MAYFDPLVASGAWAHHDPCIFHIGQIDWLLINSVYLVLLDFNSNS
jgi:hypothetical protein